MFLFRKIFATTPPQDGPQNYNPLDFEKVPTLPTERTRKTKMQLKASRRRSFRAQSGASVTRSLFIFIESVMT